MRVKTLMAILAFSMFILSSCVTSETAQKTKATPENQLAEQKAEQSKESKSSDSLKAIDPVPAHAFSLRDNKGGTQSLADYGGKVVWVTFWATWCHACKNEMKHLDEIRRKLDNPDFEVLAINTDTPDRQSMAAAQARALKVGFPILFDQDSRVAAKYNPSGELPYSVLVDAKGDQRFIQRGFLAGGEDEIEKRIHELLSEK